MTVSRRSTNLTTSDWRVWTSSPSGVVTALAPAPATTIVSVAAVDIAAGVVRVQSAGTGEVMAVAVPAGASVGDATLTHH